MTVAALITAALALIVSVAAFLLVVVVVAGPEPYGPDPDDDDPDDGPGDGPDIGPDDLDPMVRHPLLDVHPGPPLDLGRATRRTLGLAGHVITSRKETTRV